MNVEETYRATVTDTADPESRGRIKVTSSGALGASDAPMPMWIEPATDWGWFLVPDVGETVEIVMSAHGDMDESNGQASIEEPDVRWRGVRYWTSAEADKPREVPADFKTNYGKRRGFATPQGHLLMFDDTEGKEKVSLMWHGAREGADKFGMFTIDEAGSVVISNINGSLIYLNAADEQLTIVDQHGNSYTSDADGIRLIDSFSNMITMADGVVQVISQGGLVLEAASGVKVGGNATMHMLLGETLIAAIDTMLAAGVPTPLDGGAGLKATMIAAWNAIKNTSLAIKGYVE